jgi:lipid-A-disaccharide synthase
LQLLLRCVYGCICLQDRYLDDWTIDMNTSKRLYVIAGEASGDLHGSNLVKSLLEQDAELIIRGWGGDLMEAAGVQVQKHIRDLAFMGFAEVLLNIKSIINNFKSCKLDILHFKPDRVILIDYPGFNLRLAKWLYDQKIPVTYYISPQIWAWKENRIHIIKKVIDQMLVILPFEKEFYKKYGMDVDYVGHPLIEAIERSADRDIDSSPTLMRSNIALLPGSRKQEINRHLPLFIEIAKLYPDEMFVIVGAPALDHSIYRSILKSQNQDNISLSNEGTYKILKASKAALVCSGTATLETALMEIPQIVCYKGNSISFYIAKKLVKIKYISLVNLILDKGFLAELIQEECNVTNIKSELDAILSGSKKETFSVHYNQLRNALIQEEYASNKAAKLILSKL